MALSPRMKTLGKAILGIGLVITMVAPFDRGVGPVHAAQTKAAPSVLVLSDQITGTWIRNFNIYNLGGQLDPTRGGIYEPLYITSVHDNAKQYPMLATAYSWSKDLKTITFTIRQGVKWSDGQPLTPDDVLFSINIGKTCTACDVPGFWGPSGLLASASESGNTVSLTFKKVNTATFASVFNVLYIVPQHIWASQKNPGTWANTDPVGSGPFTQVSNFSGQSYDVGKNPNYWQPGKPQFDTLRVVNHTGNDSALLDMKAGKIDWSGNLVTDVANAYDKLNPNFKHYYSNKTTAVQLVLNQAKYPYSIPALRQAVSMAINRQAVASIGEYGYALPSDTLGLNGQFANWIDPTLAAKDKQLSTYNPDAAKALLKKAGFTWSGGGALLDPKGKQVDFDIYTVTGWSDWYTSCTIMAQNLGAIGINAGVHQFQFGDWYAHLWGGNFDAAIVWQMNSDSPYTLFNNFMALSDYYPVGTQAAKGSDIGRYKSAAADALLSQYASTLDTATQRQAAYKLEAIWLNDLPTIPLFIPGIWEDYNTTRFTGFPDASNYYASGQPGDKPDIELVLLNVKPK